uniref:Uncharacterized protein n=1 Tax=Brassica oleracea var. oleracea TaxID=109376 RepID=A0A0D3EI26_BRAOL
MVLEAQTRSSSSRRRQRRISPALNPLTMLLLSLTLVVRFHCSMYWLSARVIWMVGTRRTRQKLRRRRGLFVTLFLVVLSCQLVFPPAMSREDSFAAAIRRSLGSNPDVLSSVCHQTSHDVHYVQAVQSSEHQYQPTSSSASSPARLESHKPLRDAPILQTDVRSRSFMCTDPKFFGILSLSPYHKVKLFTLPSILLDCGFTGFPPPCSTSLYISCGKKLQEVLPGSVLFRSSSSFEEKLLPPFPLSIERGVSSVSLPSVCFSFLIGLLSCVAVSTGPEDAIEITSVFLVDEVWTSTSLYVTIIQLSDFVVKATSTYSSTVSNSLSSSIEDLSCLVYLCVVCYVYGQRGWIIPYIYCSDEV